MNEEEAVTKMKDLQEAIITVTRYSRARAKFPKLFLIFLFTILLSALISFLVNYYDYLTYYPYMGGLPIIPGGYVSSGVFAFLVWIGAIFFSYRILVKPFREPYSLNWEKDLDEGILGIIKIVEHEDWDKILSDLKKAKQSFLAISILQFLLYWILATVLVYFAYGFLINALFGIPGPLYLVPVAAGFIVIGLGDSSIKKSYNELWYMDDLVSELRWFYLEFQGSGL